MTEQMNTGSALHAVNCSAIKSKWRYCILWEIRLVLFTWKAQLHQEAHQGFPAGALTSPPGVTVDLLKRNWRITKLSKANGCVTACTDHIIKLHFILYENYTLESIKMI